MSNLYIKENGTWVSADFAWVKKQGVWRPVNEVWVKKSGSWQRIYEYDVTPPDPPVVTLTLVDNWSQKNELLGRWINVAVRTQGASHDADLRRIRVLTTFNGKPPTTVHGGTFTSAADDNWPNEPWSEWRYNGFGTGAGHADSSVLSTKQWTRNSTNGDILKDATTFYFTAWSEDLNGNWSGATAAQLTTPKAGVEAENLIVKEARFQANSSGTWKTGTGFQSGELIQQNRPTCRGLWFHGNQLADTIGTQGAPHIRSAQILVRRQNDAGTATSNVYLFHHNYVNPAAITGTPVFSEVTKVGTISKGETKWFDIPASFYDDLNTGIRGFGLNYKDPIKADGLANDYTKVESMNTYVRSGEVHMVWDEHV
jgi:hypothetical protein